MSHFNHGLVDVVELIKKVKCLHQCKHFTYHCCSAFFAENSVEIGIRESKSLMQHMSMFLPWKSHYKNVCCLIVEEWMEILLIQFINNDLEELISFETFKSKYGTILCEMLRVWQEAKLQPQSHHRVQGASRVRIPGQGEVLR